MPRDEKGRFTKENLDLSLPHPFTILKYLIIFLIVFPWYKFFTKTDILEFFYNKVVDCPKQDCSICPKSDCSTCPKEKEVIIGHCKPCEPCDKVCKPCEEKICPPCNLKCNNGKCPDPTPCPVCPVCEEKLNLEES